MRTLSPASALLLSIVLSGCGSGFHGSVSGGGGGTPQPGADQPVVTGLSPASVVAGGPGFTLTVTGRNFAQGDTVQWESFSLASTYVSSSRMIATVPASLLDVVGTPSSASIIVQTPVPSTLNFGTSISITSPPAPGSAGFTLATVGVQANDIVWDPGSQQIYLSVADTDPANPNSVIALNPTTSQFGAVVSAGSGANRVAVSSDGSWIYAGLDKDGIIQRFTLPGLKPDISIPLGKNASLLVNRAIDLAPDPVASNTIAVSQAASMSEPGNVVIYDGVTPRPATVTSVGGEPEPLGSLCWNASGTDLYGAFGLEYSNPMGAFSVNSTGVQLVQLSGSVNMGTIACSALTGNVYGNYGQTYDPSKNGFIGNLPLNVLGGGIPSGQLTPLAIDDKLGFAWMLAQTVNSPAKQMTIAAFDLRTNALLGSIAIPNVTGTPVKLIRWGSNGLAFLTNESDGPHDGDGLYILSGAFVTNPSVQQIRATGGRAALTRRAVGISQAGKP